MNNKTFYPFYQARIERMIQILKKECAIQEVIADGAWMQIASGLYQIFHRAAVRTLIVEMHKCLREGRIKRSTPKNEYNLYLELLKNPDYREEISEHYPGLETYLDVLEDNQYDFWMEFFERLKDDLVVIKRSVKVEDERYFIKDIKANCSDSHNGGRSVIRIVFNNDASLFYKNHSLENERFLQKLLEKINTSIGWNSYSYQILDKNTYGWVEEVTNLECRNEEEIRAFYFRTGILVAVSYILGIGDLHYENMVAHGEYPILVDVETLFQNIDKDVYRWEIKENLFYSVLTSGLFPGGTIGANMSGITGGTGDFEREAAILLNDQTSEMRIGYTHPRIEPGKNRAFLNGKETIISSYEKEILYGFQYTYKWFMQNQDVVLEMVERRKYKLFSRYLSGGTQFFGGAINASTHPQLLCNQEGRREYLEFIVKGRKLCNFEKNAMLRGDIPYFFRRIGDKRLYTDKEISSVFFKMSIIEKLKVRLKKISIADCELQQKVLHLSVRIFGEKREWNNTLDEITDVVGFSNEYMDKSYVKKIADHLLDNMVCSKDKVLWLTVVVEDKMLCIKPADLYFYSGIAGIAVFWGKLSIDYPEYAKLCSNLDQMLFSYTDKVYNREIEPRTRYTGMYCGEGSIAYTVIALFQAEIADNIFSPIIIRMFYPGWHNSCIVII